MRMINSALPLGEFYKYGEVLVISRNVSLSTISHILYTLGSRGSLMQPKRLVIFDFFGKKKIISRMIFIFCHYD